MIQLYGSFDDYMSMANVSRALAASLKARKLQFNIRATGTIKSQYLDAPWPKNVVNDNANVGIYVGYPPPSVSWLKNHKVKVLVTVCETNAIPPEWTDACNTADYIIVPSRFCQQVFKDSHVTSKIVVVPHGAHFVHTEPPPKLTDRINILHVSGALSFPRRKGTFQLIRAWNAIEAEYPSAHLTLRTKMGDGYIDQLGLKNVHLDDGGSLAPHYMASYLRRFDAVIQPSRGEGFGIVPLEARCLGIPAIITAVSGHSEHFAAGVDVLIPTKDEYGLLQTQANSVGFAPLVHHTDIENALRTFLADVAGHKQRAAQWAGRFGPLWLWKNTLKPLGDLLAPLAHVKDRVIKFQIG